MMKANEQQVGPSWDGGVANWESYKEAAHLYVGGTKYGERLLRGPRAARLRTGAAKKVIN